MLSSREIKHAADMTERVIWSKWYMNSRGGPYAAYNRSFQNAPTTDIPMGVAVFDPRNRPRP